MQRVLAVSLAVLMVFTVGASGAAARRGDREPSFAVTASQHATPGGWFRVAVRVKRAAPGSALGATAVVRFATGDVTLTLTPKGRAAYVAAGRVRVAGDETGGPVPVDVSVSYGAETITVAGEGNVDGPEPVTEPTPEPTPTEPPVEY